MSKKSFFTEKVKKMNEFAEKNPWVKFFSWFPPLVALIWKMLVWAYEKILSRLWKRLKEINWDWNKINFVLVLLHLFIAVVLVCLFCFRENKEKIELKYFYKKLEKEMEWVNEEIEKILLKNLWTKWSKAVKTRKVMSIQERVKIWTILYKKFFNNSLKTNILVDI